MSFIGSYKNSPPTLPPPECILKKVFFQLNFPSNIIEPVLWPLSLFEELNHLI